MKEQSSKNAPRGKRTKRRKTDCQDAVQKLKRGMEGRAKDT